MPNELQSLLDATTRRTAQSVPATIWGPVGDGTGDYLVRLASTGALVRASVASAGLTFAKRTPVMLISPDDGTVASSRYVISQLRVATVFGSAVPNPVSDETEHDGIAVTYINPRGVSLFAGGGAVVFDVYGTGLPNTMISASDAGIVIGGTFVSNDHITISVTAGGGVSKGSYDLIIEAVPSGDIIAFPKFFTVT